MNGEHGFEVLVLLLVLCLASLSVPGMAGQPAAATVEPGILYVRPASSGSGDCTSWADACPLQTALAVAAAGDEIWAAEGVYRPNAGLLPSCQAIRDADPAAADGEYVIDPNGQAFTVYCHDMAGTPREYLTLPHGSLNNYAQYSATPAQGTDVRTSYDKVRLDPLTLTVDIGDQTFATASGSLQHGGDTVVSMPYGVAMDCKGDFSQTGVARIDLRGTPFRVFWLDETFSLYGTNPDGEATWSDDWQVVSLTGGGNCGWIAPDLPPSPPYQTVPPPDTTLESFCLNLRYYYYGRGVSFRLKSGVALYGGFAGTETVRDERDWGRHVTILSGDLNGNDPNVDGIVQDWSHVSSISGNAEHVLVLDGTTQPITTTTVIDGLVITGGYAHGLGVDQRGGGLYCAGSGSGAACSPTVSNVLFSGNRADWGGGALFAEGYDGGSSSPVLTNVAFRGNGAGSYGGAIYNGGDNGGTSSPVLTSVTFLGNDAGSLGGALFNAGYNGGSSTPLLANAIVWYNTAPGGAQIYNNAAVPTIRYSDVQDAYDAGGAWDAALGLDGGGNLDVDPRFAAVPDPGPYGGWDEPGDPRLRPDSPVIDAGDNAALPAEVSRDLVGRPRFLDAAAVPDTGSGAAPIVDMGAYEALPPLLHVDGDAPPGGDGASWATAFADLQDALGWAVASVEVWVAEGVYLPGTVPTDTFRVGSGVALYGGFAGHETGRDQRDPTAHPTVLSGDVDQNDVNDDGDQVAESWTDVQGTNAYRVLSLHATTGKPITETTRVDGFTITAGQANDPTLYAAGAGIECRAWSEQIEGTTCSPSLNNLVFAGNVASAAAGGGFACTSDGIVTECSPTLRNVVFRGNKAGSGGGMAVVANRGSAQPVLINVLFDGNEALGCGGGMIATDEGLMGGSVKATFLNVVFTGNRARYNGGGMCNLLYKGSVTLSLTNVVFAANVAETSGGAIHNGEGYYSTAPWLRLSNVTFTGNQAGVSGGAVSGHPSPASLLDDLIVWGNEAPTGPQIDNDSVWNLPTFRHSDIQDAYDRTGSWDASLGIDGGGNLDADPLFVRPPSPGPDATWGTADDDYGNLRLQPLSPAVDAGDNALLPPDTYDLDGDGDMAEPLPVDLDWHPRLADGDRDATAIVDMGAYELAWLRVYVPLVVRSPDRP